MRKLLLLIALALASCAAQRPCIPITDTVEIPTNQHLHLDSVWVLAGVALIGVGKIVWKIAVSMRCQPG